MSRFLDAVEETMRGLVRNREGERALAAPDESRMFVQLLQARIHMTLQQNSLDPPDLEEVYQAHLSDWRASKGEPPPVSQIPLALRRRIRPRRVPSPRAHLRRPVSRAALAIGMEAVDPEDMRAYMVNGLTINPEWQGDDLYTVRLFDSFNEEGYDLRVTRTFLGMPTSSAPRLLNAPIPADLQLAQIDQAQEVLDWQREELEMQAELAGTHGVVAGQQTAREIGSTMADIYARQMAQLQEQMSLRLPSPRVPENVSAAAQEGLREMLAEAYNDPLSIPVYRPAAHGDQPAPPLTDVRQLQAAAQLTPEDSQTLLAQAYAEYGEGVISRQSFLDAVGTAGPASTEPVAPREDVDRMKPRRKIEV